MYCCERKRHPRREDELKQRTRRDVRMSPSCDAYLEATYLFRARKCCLTENLRTLRCNTWHRTLGIDCKISAISTRLFIQTSSLRDRFPYVYVELMIHIITEDPVYIRMVDVQIFNSARVFTQTRCIVGITLCGCVWLFDKTIPLGNSFYLYNPPIAQR